MRRGECDFTHCFLRKRDRPWVEEFINEHRLETTVHLLGRYPIETMPAIFSAADVVLATLKDSRIFNLAAGDSEAFAALLRRMRSLEPSELAAMGARGEEYCSSNFDFSHSVATIEALMAGAF